MNMHNFVVLRTYSCAELPNLQHLIHNHPMLAVRPHLVAGHHHVSLEEAQRPLLRGYAGRPQTTCPTRQSQGNNFTYF